MPERLGAALDDRYRLERELGAGGMATVYLAEDLKHHRKVAIKVLKPELAAVLGAERFVQEIRTTAQLQHPHILPLFDSGEAGGILYYVMPYIQGETIRETLNRETQFGIDEAVRITTEVADALDYAHRHGVIHRDIKPENILLHDGRAMVMDFGIALAVSAAAGGRMTETGLSLGTPHYMSPEQATADKDITARSDIYSLASVLYEMLAGVPPHEGGSAQQTIMRIIVDTPRPVTELRKSVPPNVAAAVAKALEKLPADRFGTAQAFRQALGDPGFTVTTAGIATASSGPGRRPWLLLAGVAAAGLVVGALGSAALRSPPPAPLTVRFPLQLSPGQEFDGRVEANVSFAMSPDGRRIAYVAINSASGRRQLFLRDVDRLDASPITGPVSPSSPFFSDDGEWIGYFTFLGRTLFKVSVEGGPPIQLAADAEVDGSAGHWSAGGWITYTTSNGGIARVRESGGPSEAVFRPDSGPFQYAAAPMSLPGDARILVASCPARGNCTPRSVQVLDVATGTLRMLIPGAQRAWYLGDERLAYHDDAGALFVVPFDPDASELAGPPVPVLQNVEGRDIGTSRVSVSRSGAMVYLPRRTQEGEELTLLELDRAGRNTGRLALSGLISHPRWSPTRDRIAFTKRVAGRAQIWIHDVASKTTPPLRSTPNGDDRPSWSPDGRQLVIHTVDDRGQSLVTVPADGSAPAESAVSQGRSGGAPFWSRDGNWILFDGAFTVATNGEDIYAVRTSGDRRAVPVVASKATEESGALSPNGQWIAYTADETGVTQVYVRPFMRPGGRWVISTGEAGGPLWTTNEELTYWDGTTQSLTAATLAFTPEPRVVRRNILVDWRDYVPSGRSVAEYDISHDGQHILALRGSRLRERPDPIVVLNWKAEVDRLMGGAK